MPRRPVNPRCRDCGADVYRIREYAYMLTEAVWKEMLNKSRRRPNPIRCSTHDLLCVGCLEIRLRREVNHWDFDWTVALNNHADFERSARLRQRMARRVS